MKIRIVTFSQTGNTRKVAGAIGDVFAKCGHEVVALPLKKADPAQSADCEVLGIGTPCFSSRAPQPVLDFIDALPTLAGKKAFVFATSGGGPGRVLYEMTTALRKKGAEVVGGIVIRGECFHPFPAIKGRFPGRPNEQDLAKAAAFARATIDHLIAGRAGPVPFKLSRRDAIKPGYSFYDIIALTNTDAQLRAALKTPEADRSKCDKCGWCAKECPMRNIALEPYPILGENCMRCYRCVTGCPKDAFVAEYRLGDFLASIVYSTLFERWLGDVGPGEKFY